MTVVPTIAELRINADSERWRAAGFTVELTIDAANSIHVGTVALQLDADPDAAPGIVGLDAAWTIPARGATGQRDRRIADGMDLG